MGPGVPQVVLPLRGRQGGMGLPPMSQGPPSPDSGSGSHQPVYSDRYADANRRRGSDHGDVSSREVESLRREVAKLLDDRDVLSEENEYLLDKLRATEDSVKEKEAETHELQKQVASLGEGATFEARLVTRKEAALKQREAALKAAREQSHDVKEVEVTQLRLEAEAAKEEAVAESEKARQAVEEMLSLRAMTQRLILTPEEKEEVVLKRCWLARYWLLAAQFGVHADVAGPQSEHWHKLAPLPVEVVVAAGQKAKEEPRWGLDGSENGGPDSEDKFARDMKDMASADSNIESMFAVEKGLRDLASLKVEEGVLLALAQHRRPAAMRATQGGGGAAAAGIADGARAVESMDLSEEEVEDVQFKQNWLVYMWRRAKSNSVEAEIARERLQYWINRTNFRPTAHDAVDAERGLVEMRKLGLEQQLWDSSRAHLMDAAERAARGSAE